jgi:hypothetical protein
MKDDNVIRLAFEQDVIAAETVDYIDSIVEVVKSAKEAPIMIFNEGHTLWIPPKMRKEPLLVLGILNKYQYLVNRIISG